MGLSYKGGASHFHSLSENLDALKDNYPYNKDNGYFGNKGQSNDNHVRNISSPDPLAESKKFYDIVAHGGIESSNYSKDNKVTSAITRLADGTVVTWRETSASDGTPAVDVNIKRSTDNGGIKRQKIHFVKE